MLTRYTWTAYLNGELLDIMTDDDLDEILLVFKPIRIDTVLGVIEF